MSRTLKPEDRISHDRVVGPWAAGGFAAAIAIAWTSPLLAQSPATPLVWNLQAQAADSLFVRFGQAMFYDASHERLLVFGGTDGRNLFGDVWEFPVSDRAWHPLHPAGELPPPRMGSTMVFDPTPPRLVLFGGWGWNDKGQISYNDCWSLALGESLSWQRLTPTGGPPSNRNHHSAVYDAARDRMLLFGGATQEVWALSLGEQPTWSRLETSGKGPGALEGHSAAYDSKRDRVLVFGGAAGNYSFLMRMSGNPPTKTLNDVWALSLAGAPTWTKLSPLGEPPPTRYYHAAVIDTARDRMIVVSGGHSRGGPESDLWSLTLGGTPRWTRLQPQGSGPSPRRMHSAAYDPTRDGLWLNGGAERGSYEGWYGAIGDTWWLGFAGPDTSDVRH